MEATIHIDSAFPSKYLKQSDLNGRVVRVTIARVEIEDIGEGDHKAVVYFEGKDKALVLNRINADTISSSFGPETDDWAGKVVELYSDPNVYYGGKKVGGLRVRVPAAAPPPMARRQQPPVQHRAEVQYTEDNPPPIDDDSVPF